MKSSSLLGVMVFLNFGLPSRGQTFHGSLRGAVTDPSGSAVANVRLLLVDQETGARRETISSQQGEYVFASLKPGRYRLTAEAAGFKRFELGGLEIGTQAAVQVDIGLQLGQISEQVRVTEELPLLQAADGSTGQLIDRRKITDLPILGRNPFYTARLAQTIVFAGNPRFTRMQDQNANAQVSISGGALRTNNYLLDGISISDSTNRAVLIPSPEAVEELKLQASTYDAEVGRTGGGAFNTLLKSGGNDLHGTAIGHIRETAWLANGFFANRAGQPRAEQPFRGWGGSLGGPVRIPKLYDGRDRTFFFVATEAYRQEDGATFALAVPTAHERRGDFSQTVNRLGSQQTIYDPSSVSSSGVRSPFPGNVIPSHRLNPVGQALVSYYPLPNLATAYHGAPNYIVTGGYPNRGDQYLGKLDQQVTSRLRLSGSYIFQKTFETNAPNLFGNAGSPNQIYCCDRKVNATQANATVIPSATVVVALRWGFNRFYSRSFPASLGFNPGALGLPAWLVAQTPNPAFPAVSMSDVSSFGGGGTSQDVFNSRTFSVTASQFVSRHSLKGGFEFRSIHDFGTPSSGPTSLDFTDVFTRPDPRRVTAGQGSSLATLLLGYPVSGSVNLVSRFDNYVHYFGGFFQDDVRVTSRLTLNLGLRWEHESGIRDTNNRLVVGFDRSAPHPLSQGDLVLKGVVLYAGVDGNPTQTFTPLAIKLGPRFGFAYSVNDRTVLRGGYGIFWAPTFFTFQNAIGYSQTTEIVGSTDGFLTPAASLSNPYPNGLLQPTGNSVGRRSGIGQPISVPDPTTRSAGYVQQASIEVQRQVVGGMVVTAGFMGSRSLGLLRNGQNINQLDPALFQLGGALNEAVPNPLFNRGGVGSVGTPTVSRSQLLRPHPQFTSVILTHSGTGRARYFASYVRAERRFSAGWSVLASYTLSRSLDDLTGVNLAGVNQITTVSGPQNAYELWREWSLSAHDVRHRSTAAVTYELPFGRGKRFLSGAGRWLDAVTGGWSINVVGILQSGFPLAVSQPNNNSVVGASHQRPNATGVHPATRGSARARIGGWLNPAAFAQAPQFTFGNLARFLNVRGPATRNLDVSIFKTFNWRERVRAQFRAEALNATNTVTFGNPNTVLTNPQFGLITNQVNNPRLVQLALRLTF